LVDLVVLCGGLGTRIASVSETTPKCLLPVGGRPALELILDHWVSAKNIDRIILCVGHLGDLVERYMGNTYRDKLILYSRDRLQGSGGALERAVDMHSLHEICVINGDTFFSFQPDVFFKEVEKISIMRGLDIPIVVTCSLNLSADADSRFDVISVDPSTFLVRKGFGGATVTTAPSNHHDKGLHVGWVYFEDALATLKQAGWFRESAVINDAWSLEKKLLRSLVEFGDLHSVLADGAFFDIGVPDDYYLANKQLRRST